MWCNQIFSLIVDKTVKNIIVADNYEVANQLAKLNFGVDAYAVDTTQYPLAIGYGHIEGFFYDEDNNIVLPNPTERETITLLQDKLVEIDNSNVELAIDADYRVSVLELGLSQ